MKSKAKLVRRLFLPGLLDLLLDPNNGDMPSRNVDKHDVTRNPDSAVGITTGYGLEDQRVGSSSFVKV
jgi:hypothetical protein